MRRFQPTLLWGLTLAIPAAVLPNSARANEQVYQKLLPSTVLVAVPVDNGKVSLGTGVLVDAERKWVVTAGHVVRDQKNAMVTFPVKEHGKLVTATATYIQKGREIFTRGKVIVCDMPRDLAVVELLNVPEDVTAVPLANDSARPGQLIHLIGNPVAEQVLWLYSYGKVRQVGHKLHTSATADGFKVTIDCQVVLTTLPLNPGDSGGPAVNDSGELVGLAHGLVPGGSSLSTLIDVCEIRTVLGQAKTVALK